MSRRTKAEKRADFIAWTRKKPKPRRRSAAAKALASRKYHQRKIPNKKCADGWRKLSQAELRAAAEHKGKACERYRGLGEYGMPEFGEV